MSFYEYCENGGSSDGCDLFVGDFSWWKITYLRLGFI